jgi:hypothetical protein
MSTGCRRLLWDGAAPTIAAVALLGVGGDRAAAFAAEGDEVEYAFVRPAKDGERTYHWHRKMRAPEATRRYGVDPKKVGDGVGS